MMGQLGLYERDCRPVPLKYLLSVSLQRKFVNLCTTLFIFLQLPEFSGIHANMHSLNKYFLKAAHISGTEQYIWDKKTKIQSFYMSHGHILHNNFYWLSFNSFKDCIYYSKLEILLIYYLNPFCPHYDFMSDILRKTWDLEHTVCSFGHPNSYPLLLLS